MHKLDDVDMVIMRALQKDGRMSNVDLADMAGISAPPCLRRLRHLEDEEFIKGYKAVLNGPALGYNVTAFIKVSLATTQAKDMQEFQAKIQEWPNVVEAHALAGDSDFLLKIVAKNWDEYQDFVMNTLPTAPGIGTSKSHLSVKTIKEDTGLPL